MLASSSFDNTVKIWDPVSGEEKCTLNGHDDYVRSVCFSPDGKHIASGSGDNTVKIWNASTGKLQSTRGHRYDPFPCIECLLS